jgi:hypothetical protein
MIDSEVSSQRDDIIEQLKLEKQVLKRAFIREQKLKSELEVKLASREQELGRLLSEKQICLGSPSYSIEDRSNALVSLQVTKMHPIEQCCMGPH